MCVLLEIPTVITFENCREGWEGKTKVFSKFFGKEDSLTAQANLNKYTFTGKRGKTQNRQQFQQLETNNGNV